MAVVEMIQSHYKSKNSVRKIMDYIMDPEKTSPELSGGVFCSPATAVREFLLTKAIHNKQNGRQIIHFTQSFAPTDNVTPELVKEIAEKFLQHPSFNGFQIAYAVHTNKAHLHTHFVINSVNYETGQKWQQTKEGLASLKAFSDEICREYGLSVIEKGSERQMSREAYRTANKGKSYIYETTLAVKAALAHADSKALFFYNMKALGYKVEWQTGRKNIIFMTPDGGHRVYDKSLYPRGTFHKENMERMLSKNVIGVKERQDFERLLNKLEGIKDACGAEDKLPLSYLREKEIQHAEQRETFVLASELFMEMALADNRPAADGTAGFGRSRSIVQLKDYLAEERKGRGLDFEHER